MMRLGLLGHDIGYSKSPILHQEIAKIFHLDISYDLLDIEESKLKDYINQLKKGVYQGFNVTKPFKEKVIPLLDQLTPIAKKIGAVNTIYIDNQLVIGDNTDYQGFLGLLKREKIDVANKKVCLLGSGGAAKACYHVLKDLNADVLVASRRKVDYPFEKVISYDEIKPDTIDIYIQATPVGTYPHIDDSIIPLNYVSKHTVIDLIYNPTKTKIMKASKQGISGIDMMVIQALKSEEIWHHQRFKLTEATHTRLKEVIMNE